MYRMHFMTNVEVLKGVFQFKLKAELKKKDPMCYSIHRAYVILCNSVNKHWL